MRSYGNTGAYVGGGEYTGGLPTQAPPPDGRINENAHRRARDRVSIDWDAISAEKPAALTDPAPVPPQRPAAPRKPFHSPSAAQEATAGPSGASRAPQGHGPPKAAAPPPPARPRVDVSVILETYKRLGSVYATARETGYGHTTVRDRLRAAGVDTTRGPLLDVAAAVAAYQEGLTVPAIAASGGHSTTTVRRALTDAGVQLRDDRAPDVPQPGSGTVALKTRLVDLGTTSTQVRAWTTTAGVDCPPRGVVPTAVLDAWQAAHTHDRTRSYADLSCGGEWADTRCPGCGCCAHCTATCPCPDGPCPDADCACSAEEVAA